MIVTTKCVRLVAGMSAKQLERRARAQERRAEREAAIAAIIKRRKRSK